MDGQRFDRLVRAWGKSTRRGAAGLAAGTAAMLLPGGAAAARCTKFGAACGRRRGDRCCGDGTCRGGRCACPRGAEGIRGACFLRGDCAPDAAVCDGRCGKTPGGEPGEDGYHDCYCGTTVGDQTVCFRNASLCDPPCATSTDCPDGHACFASNCQGPSGSGACLKPCRRRHLD